MAGESLARRDARAVFELALEQNQSLDDWLRDLDKIQEALSDPQVAGALEAPKLRFEQKRDLIDRALASLDQSRRNLMYVLIERHRTASIAGIARELRLMVHKHQGIAEATVTTAVPIPDSEAARIGEQLGRLVGKRVVVERRVDPAIIGGVVVRVGDTLINGSVAGRLAALQEQLRWS